MTTTQRIWASSGLWVVLFLVTGIVCSTQLRTISNETARINAVDAAANRAVNEMEVNILSATLGAARYLTTGHDPGRKSYRQSSADFEKARLSYGRFATTDRRKAWVERLDVLYHEYKELGDALVADREANQANDVRRLLRFFELRDALSNLVVNEIRIASRSDLATARQATYRAVGTVLLTLAFLAVGGLVLGVSLNFITGRRVIQTEKTLQLAKTELAERADQLEEVVAERTAALRATNEQLEAFVYSIAHDLRAPLRAMTGFAQILLDDYASKLDDAARSYLERICASGGFMDKLILDLLAYGRSARTAVDLDLVDVKKAWEVAIFQTATQVEQTKARIEVVGPLPVVLAHEATLGQCLANLISNSLKFVADGVQPHIRFRAEEMAPSGKAGHGGARVRLWVEDNGIGIAQEHQERAFRVFERLNGSRHAGTGIGLSIVRKGVERMGGTVGMLSEPGRGSQFWIELAKAN